jgi:chromosome partitioning protein
MASLTGRERVLGQRLESVNSNFDICVIDCSPSLGLLTLNALVASDEVIIPVQAHYYALEGMKQLIATINIVKERFNSRLKIRGILLTFVEDRTLLCRQIQDQMKEFFNTLLLDTVIHRTIKLAEAPSAGEPIQSYAPLSRGAIEYEILAKEVV